MRLFKNKIQFSKCASHQFTVRENINKKYILVNNYYCTTNDKNKYIRGDMSNQPKIKKYQNSIQKFISSNMVTCYNSFKNIINNQIIVPENEFKEHQHNIQQFVPDNIGDYDDFKNTKNENNKKKYKMYESFMFNVNLHMLFTGVIVGVSYPIYTTIDQVLHGDFLELLFLPNKILLGVIIGAIMGVYWKISLIVSIFHLTGVYCI